MGDREVLTFHGWGFDSRCWNAMQKRAHKGIRWKNFDRGYFGSPHPVHFTRPNSKKVIITHSYGFHLCPPSLLKQVDVLVIMAGFLQFHPSDDPAQKRSKRMVNLMLDDFDRRPLEILQAFYKNVHYPSKEYRQPPSNFDKQLLFEDLRQLHTGEIAVSSLKKSAKVCIFHGAKDKIVSPQKGQVLKKKLGKNAHYEKIEEAGHALPMNNAEQCWSRIAANILAEQTAK